MLPAIYWFGDNQRESARVHVQWDPAVFKYESSQTVELVSEQAFGLCSGALEPAAHLCTASELTFDHGLGFVTVWVVPQRAYGADEPAEWTLRAYRTPPAD